MLQALHIKNIAVIDEITIEFQNGFNVLTGETGAGKSIIIDAINMVLGQRTSRELIRHGEKKALVEAVFSVTAPALLEKLEEYGIEAEEGMLLLYRDMHTDGKSTCRINGQLVTANMLKELARFLINIHGQHDNQSLLVPARHIGFLDTYSKLNTLLDSYQQVYREMQEIKRQITALTTDEQEKNQRIDILKYQIQEIQAADLKPEEEQQLAERHTFLNSAGAISQALENARNSLYSGSEYGGSVHDLLAETVQQFAEIAKFDETLSGFYTRLNDVAIELDDVIYQIRDYADTMQFDEQELDGIEQRLSLIHGLKRKYGNSIPEILDYYQSISQELSTIEHSGEQLQQLEAEQKKLMEKLEVLAAELTQKRTAGAKELERKILQELQDLDMQKVDFQVQIIQGDYKPNGWDTVEFLIATNVGDTLKPLSKIASGGEMSRIMLAMKSVLSDADEVETLIFDEIDTGVSGRASQKIAEKISKIAGKKQILCITHLPQIASMGDAHFLIDKQVSDGKTVTSVSLLEGKAREEELARIISGARITDLTLQSAREMLELAESSKEKN